MEQERAIVLLSGGQDSTTCLYWALKRFSDVTAIAFNYGQKHEVELKQAEKIATDAGVDLRLVDVRGLLTGGALINHEQDVSNASHLDDNLPASFTAGRNILFLTIAASWARELDISNIVTGVCQTDYSGYPDCRNNFITAMEKALSLGLDDTKLAIHTPLMWLDKAETWKMAADLGVLDVIINDTHTDYNGERGQLNEWGYGKLDNAASELRAKGYFEAKEKGWV